MAHYAAAFGIIYRATNRVNGKVYVGQTINTLKRRMSTHRQQAKHSDSSNHFHNAIKKHGWEAFEVEIIDSADSAEELNYLEIYWIRFYCATNPDKGYNTCLGGADRTMSQASRDKQRASMIEGYATGRIVAPWLGKKRSPETIKKIIKTKAEKIANGWVSPKKGKRVSKEERDRLVGMVPQYAVKCLETGVEYPSIKEALLATGFQRGSLSRCIRTGGTHHGLHWDYVDSENHQKAQRRKRTPAEKAAMSLVLKGKPTGRHKTVTCVETGQTFRTLKEAAQWSGAQPTKIGEVIRGNRLTAGGYHWIRMGNVSESGVTLPINSSQSNPPTPSSL